MIRLTNGMSVCEVHPEIGGSIGRWTIGDQDMLRTARHEAIVSGTSLEMSTFPLVPYSNRIGHGRFEWNGQIHRLAPPFSPEPHCIHGVGWQKPWQVEYRDDTSVKLVLRHSADEGWPWPFDAWQEIGIAHDQLTIVCGATNRADIAVPLAFGHHPYFDADGATLMFDARQVWLSGIDNLPTRPVAPSGAFDFGVGAPVAGRHVDHCYTGLGDIATIRWHDRPRALAIRSSPPLPAAVVYIPQNGSAFCFEPVPHVSNAVNMPTATPSMPVVEPGASIETRISFGAFRS